MENIQTEINFPSKQKSSFKLIAKIFIAKGKVLQGDNYLNQILRIDLKNEAALELRREI